MYPCRPVTCDMCLNYDSETHTCKVTRQPMAHDTIAAFCKDFDMGAWNACDTDYYPLVNEDR